jgi:hypothetical protein
MSDVKQIHRLISDFESQLQGMVGGKVSISWVPANLVSDLEMLKMIILNVTKVSWPDITSKSRYRHIVMARHLFCWFAFHRFGRNKSDLKRIIGIDHTTVIHGIKMVDDLLQTKDVLMCDCFNKISNQLIKYEETKT